MKNDPHIGQLFSAEEEPCPSFEEMQAYASGKLPPVERHAFERHLLNCELCSIAYEGLADAELAEVQASVAAITAEAWNRVAVREKRKRRGVYVWMSGAAAILLLIVVGYFITDGPGSNKDLQTLAETMLEESDDFEDTAASSEDREEVMDYADGAAPPKSEDARFRNDESMVESEAIDRISEVPVEIADVVEESPNMVEEEAALERSNDNLQLDMAPPASGNLGWTEGLKKDAPGRKETLGGLEGSTTATTKNQFKDLEKKPAPKTTTLKFEQQGAIVNNGLSGVADSTVVYHYNTQSPSLNTPLKDAEPVFAMEDEDLDYGDVESADDEIADSEFGFAGADDFYNGETEEVTDGFDGDALASPPVDQPLIIENTVTLADKNTTGGSGSTNSTLGGVNSGISRELDEVVVASEPAKRSNTVSSRNAKGKAPVTRDDVSDSKTREYKESEKSSYEQGVVQFQRKQYQEAATNLRQAAADTPDNLNAHLLAAKSFLQLKQPNAAIYHLDRILSVPNNSLKDDAKWFKSIALLQLGKKTDAKKLLKDVESSGGNRSKAAKKALDKF